MNRNLIWILAFFLLGAGPAKESRGFNEKQEGLIQSLVQNYSSHAQVDMAVEKTTTMSLLQRTTKQSGNISITSKGLFYWEILEPNKSLLVFDGQFVWNEEKLPEDFGGGYKVLKSKKFKDSPAYQILRMLMGEGSFSEQFSAVRTAKEEGKVKMVFTPKSSQWDLSLVYLYLDEKGEKLEKLVYFDNMENQTSLDFSKVELLKNQDKKKFTYKPPKGAQVSEI